HAAVDLERGELDAGVLRHRVGDFARLVGGRLEGGAGDVALVDVASQADEHAARVALPVRREQAGEGGHDVHATGIIDGAGERLDVCRLLDDAEVVAQPLHQRAGDGDRAFQRVHCRLVADLVGQGGQQ